MKVFAINGSPRKNKNTATLLDKALEGVKDAHPEAEVERVDLYDLHYTGCKSCFACKVDGGKHYGKCAIQDDLHPVLERLADADGIIVGSPVYYSTITGQLHAFYERFYFPQLVYAPGYPTLGPHTMKTACIYTMNVTEAEMDKWGYREHLGLWDFFLEKYITKPQILFSFNTYQFDDYSKYVCTSFSEKEKRAHREKQFPIDCENAFILGHNLLGAV